MTRKRLADFALFLLVLVTGILVYIGCEQTVAPEPDKNKAPETVITVGPSEEEKTFYRVHLFWKGFDDDGLIRGFEYSLGDTTRRDAEWLFTSKTDSEFVFPTATDEDQSQVADHLFFIRAIDNEGKEDRTPASLDFTAFSTVEPRALLLSEVALAMAKEGDKLFVAGGENGLDIYDVSDVENITRERTVFTGGDVTDLAIRDGYAFLADGLQGITVLDVRDPVNSEVVGSFETSGRLTRTLALWDNYLFAADATNGLLVLDITDPTAPAFFARYRPASRPTFVSVAVDGEYVYAGVESLGVLSIIFDPDSDDLKLIPVSHDSLFQIRHPRDIRIVDDLLLVAAADDGLRIASVAADGSLSGLGELETGGSALAVDVAGEYAYLADGENGLVSIDISDPSLPVEASQLDFSGDVTGLALSGDSLFLGNNDRGIVLVDISSPRDVSMIVHSRLRFCAELIPLGGGVFDTLRSPAERETLLAYSSVKFCWEGISLGGKVTGYRYKLSEVNQAPIEVGPDAVSVVYDNLDPFETYTFTVDTRDETGLWSAGDASARRHFTVNFDPETTIDSIWYDPNIPGADFIDITGQQGVRIEDSSTIYFKWSITDLDAELPDPALRDSVIGSFWRVKGAGFFSPDSIESRHVFTGQAGPLPPSPPGAPYVLEIGGIDSFGRREGNGGKFEFKVNFAPSVDIVTPQPGEDLGRTQEIIVIEMDVRDPDGPPNLVLLDYKLELITDAGRNRVAIGEAVPAESGLNGEGVRYGLELDLLGSRGIFEFTVTPLDRGGSGTPGETRTVTFFVTS